MPLPLYRMMVDAVALDIEARGSLSVRGREIAMLLDKHRWAQEAQAELAKLWKSRQ